MDAIRKRALDTKLTAVRARLNGSDGSPDSAERTLEAMFDCLKLIILELKNKA